MWKKYYEDAGQWISSCEENFQSRLVTLADELLAIDHLKIIRLSGPTCSGKTTLANLLKQRFAQKGKHLHLISIDDFYYDKAVLHARGQNDLTGHVDYDSVKTIDLKSLQRFTKDIFEKDVADCPIFDFKEGRRTGVRHIKSRERDVFLFEGIQVLYPEVSSLLHEYGDSAGIYISPQSELRVGDTIWTPNELRLLRRLVRDYHFRGTSATQTFFLWEGVRLNEEAHIFPYVEDCTYRIDSTMPYEIGILKPFLSEILASLDVNSPYRKHADEILKKLEIVEPLSVSLIPENSLYREFV